MKKTVKGQNPGTRASRLRADANSFANKQPKSETIMAPQGTRSQKVTVTYRTGNSFMDQIADNLRERGLTVEVKTVPKETPGYWEDKNKQREAVSRLNLTGKVITDLTLQYCVEEITGKRQKCAYDYTQRLGNFDSIQSIIEMVSPIVESIYKAGKQPFAIEFMLGDHLSVDLIKNLHKDKNKDIVPALAGFKAKSDERPTRELDILYSKILGKKFVPVLRNENFEKLREYDSRNSKAPWTPKELIESSLASLETDIRDAVQLRDHHQYSHGKIPDILICECHFGYSGSPGMGYSGHAVDYPEYQKLMIGGVVDRLVKSLDKR